VTFDPKLASLGAAGTDGHDASDRSRRSSDRPDATLQGEKLAKLAGEFESMLLLQMLREMRKSGSWKEEDEDKAGFGADTLFDTLDVEIASYITKAQGLGLEKSLVKQVLGESDAAAPSWGPPSGGPGPAEAAPHISGIADRVETSPFGWRRDPFSGAATYHRGVDLRAAYGEPIGAADAGTVVFAGEQRGYGQTVVVEHAGGVRTRYAHLSSLTIEAGANVKAGDTIGRAGKSGRATGPHLHFEVTQNGRHVDPHTFVPGGLKLERVTADWGVANGPTLPGVASEGHGSGAD
jgi:murein DD-endopeptidase MepM/ murein hydrolase activator NlpD